MQHDAKHCNAAALVVSLLAAECASTGFYHDELETTGKRSGSCTPNSCGQQLAIELVLAPTVKQTCTLCVGTFHGLWALEASRPEEGTAD